MISTFLPVGGVPRFRHVVVTPLFMRFAATCTHTLCAVWSASLTCCSVLSAPADLKEGKELNGLSYKVHLDGYNQMDMLTGKGPSKRHEILYLTETTLGAVRIDDYKYRFTDQPMAGWPPRKKSIGPYWSTYGWIPTSGRGCTTAKTTVR